MKKATDILRKHLYNNGCKFIDIPSEKMEKAIKEAINEALILHDVSQQRELLLAYEVYNASEDDKKNNMNYLEGLVDTYLANNCG